MMHTSKQLLINKEILINISNNSLTTNSLTTTQLRSLHLFLQLQIQNSPATTKELLLQVTDESDPLLLLSTIITENGYQNLRSSQGLLVDFNSFPHHFSDLIKKCIEEQQKESPKFILVLRTTGHDIPSSSEGGIGKISLEVVELNAFKHLCHLSLNLASASLPSKLAHLASCIGTLKSSLSEERLKWEGNSMCLVKEVEGLRERLAAKTKEADCARADTERKMSLEAEMHTRHLKEENAITLKMKSDCDRKLAREKREWEGRLEEQSRKAKAESASLRKAMAELSSSKERLEQALRDAKQSLGDCEDKLRRHAKDLNAMAKERSDAKREAQLRDDSLRKLKQQVAHQEKSRQEADALLKSNASQLAILSHEKGLLQEKLEFCQAKLEKREEGIQALVGDFQKSLDIINKFKQKIKEKSEEISYLSSSVEEQKNALEERDKELKALKDEREELSKKAGSREAELEGVQAKLREREEKVGQQEADLRRNDNVIAWLNKQLNEIESTGALVKKAPLAEAYVHQPFPSRGARFSSPPFNPPRSSLTASTPLSAHSGALPNFHTSSAPSNIIYPATKCPSAPNVPEQIDLQTPEANKENSAEGLDARYLEPSKKQAPLPVRGILRANAVAKAGEKTAAAAKRGDARPKAKVKAKQSTYFANT